MTVDPVKDAISRLPGWAKSLLAMASLLITLGSAYAAWDTLGLPKVATQGHVDEKITDVRTEVRAIRQQGMGTKIDVKEVNRAVLTGKRFDTDLWLRQNPNADVRLRAELEQRVRDLNDEISNIDRELSGLKVMQESRGGR